MLWVAALGITNIPRANMNSSARPSRAWEETSSKRGNLLELLAVIEVARYRRAIKFRSIDNEMRPKAGHQQV